MHTRYTKEPGEFHEDRIVLQAGDLAVSVWGRETYQARAVIDFVLNAVFLEILLTIPYFLLQEILGVGLPV